MNKLDFVEVPPDDLRPLHGPPCGAGPQGHTWHLGVEEGRVHLSSGCDECDEAVLGPMGVEDIFMDDIAGTIKFIPEHENLGGWHGTIRCDCGYCWQFIPKESE